MKNLCILIFSFLSVVPLIAQESLVQNIKGQVIDADTGLPLIGANVLILDENEMKGVSTDFDGYYEFQALPVGRYSLACSYLGYSTDQANNMLLTSGKELIINFALTEEVIVAEEVTIVATKDANVDVEKLATISVQTFDAEVANRYAGSRNDVARMAAGFAGVSANEDSRNDIVIRGNSPSGLLWKLDGIDIPNPSHFGALGSTGGPVSMLNNNLMDNSTFMTGAFPAMYGNALSGVFDLSLRKGNRDKHEFTGGISFNGVELGAEGPLSRNSGATYLVNYRYSVVDLVSRISSVGSATGTGNAIPRYQDLSFKVHIPTERLGSFSLIGLGGTSGIDFLIEEQEASDDPNFFSGANENLRYRTNMGVTALTNKHYYSNKTFGKASLAFSTSGVETRVDTVNADFEEGAVYRDNSTLSRIRLAYDIKSKFNAQHSLRAGIATNQLGFSFVDSVRIADDTFRKLRNFDGQANLLQGYAQWQFRLNNALTTNLGIFSQYYTFNGTYSIEPRFNLRYEIHPNFAITAGLGRHSKLQDFQLYLIQTTLSDGTVLTTNKDLGMSISDQAMVGFDWSLPKGWSLKTEAYYQDLKNIPIEQGPSFYSAINEGADFTIPSVDSLVNNGTGTNYGLEFTIQKGFNKGFYLLSTLSIFDSKYIGSDGIERSTAFDNGYVFNVLTGKEWTLGDKLSIATDIKATRAGGRRYTPFDLEASALAGEGVLSQDQIFGKRFDDYQRIDLKLTLRHNMKRASQEWSIDMQNVLDNKNVFGQSYNAETGQVETTFQLGRYPVILYKITF